MNKEIVSSKKMIAMLAVFMIGSSIITGGSSTLVQDSWISIITGALISVPVILVYVRIIKLFPNKNIYEISLELFGKVFGKIIIIFITWYALHLGALVLRNFSEFIQITSKPETPQIIVMLAIVLVACYLVKSGIKTIGRWSLIVLFIISVVVLITIILGSASNRIENLLPIFDHKPMEFLKDSYLLFSYPYAEIVLFLTISDSLKRGENPHKIYFYGVGIAALILLLVVLRNISLLGYEMMKISLFPSYTAVRIIGVGKFLTKVEGIVMINFILLGVSKITITLLAASKGITTLFNVKNYKMISFPVAFLMVALGITIYENTIEMFEFIDIYSIYAIPFQIIIPLIIWIFAEINIRKMKKEKIRTNPVLV